MRQWKILLHSELMVNCHTIPLPPQLLQHFIHMHTCVHTAQEYICTAWYFWTEEKVMIPIFNEHHLQY